MWSLIARMCAHPRVFSWLVNQAMKRPYFHIGDYMRRWWLVPETSWCSYAIRVHHILRPDADDDLHDHPVDFRSIILSGWYVEEDSWGGKCVWSEGSTRAMRAERLHRIDEVSVGGVWTLFLMRRPPHGNRWGVLTGAPPRKVAIEHYKTKKSVSA